MVDYLHEINQHGMSDLNLTRKKKKKKSSHTYGVKQIKRSKSQTEN